MQPQPLPVRTIDNVRQGHPAHVAVEERDVGATIVTRTDSERIGAREWIATGTINGRIHPTGAVAVVVSEVQNVRNAHRLTWKPDVTICDLNLILIIWQVKVHTVAEVHLGIAG